MREKNPRTIISMEFFPFISSLIVIHTTISPNTVNIGKD